MQDRRFLAAAIKMNQALSSGKFSLNADDALLHCVAEGKNE